MPENSREKVERCGEPNEGFVAFGGAGVAFRADSCRGFDGLGVFVQRQLSSFGCPMGRCLCGGRTPIPIPYGRYRPIRLRGVPPSTVVSGRGVLCPWGCLIASRPDLAVRCLCRWGCPMVGFWTFSGATVGICEGDFGACFSLGDGAVEGITLVVAKGRLVVAKCRAMDRFGRFGAAATSFEWRHHLGEHWGSHAFACPNAFASLVGDLYGGRDSRLQRSACYPASLPAKTLANGSRLSLGG
ncbi:MAG: hypothetical protein LKKZDAJK_000499 [Candidatus Fervidibacter sp.]